MMYMMPQQCKVQSQWVLIGASLSEPHTGEMTDFRCMHICIYICIRTSLTPKPPTHVHTELTPILAHFSLYCAVPVDVEDSLCKLTLLPRL